MTTTYCSSLQVSSLLGRAEDFSVNTRPTKAHVEDIINAAEDEVDRYTNTAWRPLTVTDEFHDFKSPRIYGRPLPSYTFWLFDVRDFRFVPFRHRPVVSPITTPTDKLEVWRGNEYEDIAATGTEGRQNDWWVDYDKGVLYFVSKWPLRERNGVRLTYRYGADAVPNDLRHATVLLSAVYLATGTVGTFLLPEGGSEPGYESRWEKWEERAYQILDHYWELRPDYI
ncbi:MAG: hypothetical protein LN413_03830 [Candidatus Thermoplasmatota archaeon]|nr:hypothetical protein [Candidatus Thermoplasmatota archaeon]